MLLSTYHGECINLFNEVLRTDAQNSVFFPAPDFAIAIENEYGRYKVWAGNVGAAHHGNTYRMSLDYRLIEAGFYKDRIAELLQDLKSSLQNASEILCGKRLPFEKSQNHGVESESDGLSDSDDISETSTSSSHSGDVTGPGLAATMRNFQSMIPNNGQKPTITIFEPENPHNKDNRNTIPKTELQASQYAIKDIVSSLYKIATVIRRPAPLDLHIRSAKTGVKHFSDFDHRYVVDKFPRADCLITTRLAKAITRRRQILKYRDQHRLRLSLRSAADKTIEPTTSTIQEAEQITGVPILKTATFGRFDSVNIRESGSKANSSVLHPSTKTTVFMPSDALDMEENQSIADTVSSYQSTTTPGRETISIPPRPVGTDGEELEEFACPYCQVLCHITNSRAWRNHVLRDLEPYMCTFTDCSEPNRTYSNRLDWAEHEMEEHRVEWHCNMPSHPPYKDKVDFTSHLLEFHSSSFSPAQLPSLLQGFRRPLDEASSICPLCFSSPRRLESHLARHLIQLCLFSIPRLHYSDDESNIGSSISGIGAGQGSHLDSESSSSHSRGSDNETDAGISRIDDEYTDLEMDDVPETAYVKWEIPTMYDGTGGTHDQHTSLADQILQNLVKSATFGGPTPEPPQDFLPEHFLAALVTSKSVVREFQEDEFEVMFFDPEHEYDQRLVQFIVSSAKKVFATVVLCGFLGNDLYRIIKKSYEDNFGDDFLPLSWETIARMSFFGSMPWNNTYTDLFRNFQYKFLAPIFSDKGFEFELDKECPMPFVWVSEEVREGKYSRVYQAKIHPSHYDMKTNVQKSTVAIKVFRKGNDPTNETIDDEIWEAESSSVQASALNHEHILQRLATITREEQRLVLCEWADGGTLRSFYDNLPRPSISPGLMKGIVKQIHGLAAALVKLNTYEGDSVRNGTLQTDDILVFKDNTQTGTFKIAGPLLTPSKHGTARYESLEMLHILSGFQEELADIWSLGCITLGLIVWLLFGSEELAMFERSIRVSGGLSYCDFDRSTKLVSLHPTVRLYMEFISNDIECTGHTALRDLFEIVRTKLLAVAIHNEPSSSIETPALGSVRTEESQTPPPTTIGSPVRATAQLVCLELEVIAARWKNDDSYWATGKPRDGITAPSLQKLSQSELSQLTTDLALQRTKFQDIYSQSRT